ncbi:hypothetical protein PVAG01_05412 [Phlyctema vagabunda]|uniref:Uncharacterized protein n=1 Tax=Phlyctema vagabunda TaxID=108571 RepID=A0ABR4PK34_9HELO
MPPSSDQDTNNAPSGISTTNKHTQKLSPGGVHIPTKNGRKNGTAKDKDGGVLAAVTKNAARLSNKASTQPKSQQPSKMDTVTSAPSESPVASPLLDAVTTASLPTSTAQNTSEWAKNVPAYSSSPSNLINLGESPPTLPSSYEDRPPNFGGWTAREHRIPNGHNPSASPPQGRRRPLSYHLDGPFQQSPDDQLSQMALYGRRTSMYSQQPRFPQPPLPHQAQAHFYGAPDANLLLSPPTPGLIPGENGFYCGFDSLPNQDPSKPAENVVVTGYEGGFSVNSVGKRGIDRTINIDGLRGGVYHAKIIPWVLIGMKRSVDYPLIVAVVHGPVSTTSDASSGEFASNSSEDNTGRPGESIRGSPRPPQSVQGVDTNTVDQYQTSVEVYSLNTKKHITTLLSLQKTTPTFPIHSPLFVAPAPEGSFVIRADAGNLVVASGTTGETWLFRQGNNTAGQVAFRCTGKVWTTTQQSLSAHSPGSNGMVDGDWHSAEPMPTTQKQSKVPILSLNGRWLAYCPAAATSQVTTRAAVHSISSIAKVPGLNAYAPPQLPPINCAVDTPGGESMIGKIAQVATQEMIKGAAYVGKQGIQAWNNYWNKSSQGGNNGHVYQTHGNMGQQFPPTHAVTNPATATNKDPGLVSIIDLDSLSQYNSSTGSAPHPLATFKVPHGCSFLSFAPSGLALFTASAKGDVQFVWDLMRVQFVKSSLLKGGAPGTGLQGPHVRQVARFSRMTIARIVDVVWTSPHGERAAMVTEHETVHILDLPASAFAWPPPRRKLPVNTTKDVSPNSEASSTPLSAASVASSAVNSLWSAAQPLVRARRSSSVASNATAVSVTAQAGHGHGPHAFAAGFSRSVGAATGRMNEMRKFSSKPVRVQLPRSLVPPSPSCVRLLSGIHNDSILVVGGGIFRIYTVRSRRADRPADKQKASRGARSVDFRLPSLPDQPIVTENLSNLHLDEDYDEFQDLRWKAMQIPISTSITSGTDSSIPQAEIESNAPYQPFHTDRRVALHIISDKSRMTQNASGSTLLSPSNQDGVKANHKAKSKTTWAFGGPIGTIKLEVGPSPTTDDEYDAPFDHRALPSSAIERVSRKAEDDDQIVVTTRRRKGSSRIGTTSGEEIDEEGFFENDCEVLDFASQRV